MLERLDVRCFQFIDEQQVVSQKQEPVPRKRLVTEELFSQQETETQQRPPLERIPGKLTLPDLSADNDLSRGTPAHKEVNKLPRDKWNPLPPQEIEHTNGKPVGKIAIPTFPNDDEKVVVNEQISQVSKLDRSRLQFTEQQVVPPKEEPVQRKRLLMDKFFDQQEIETQQRPPAEKMPGKIALPDFRADSESSRDTSAHKEVKRLSKDTWNPLLPKEKEHSNDKPVGKIAMPTFTNNEDKVVVKEQIPQASKLDVRCFQFIDEQQVVSQKQEPVPRKRLVTEELFSQQETETQQRPPLEKIPGKLTLPDLSADNDLSRGTPAHKEVNKLPRDKWNPLPPQEIEHTNGKPVGKIAIPTFPNDDEKVVVNEQISQVSKLDRSRLQFTEQQVVPPKEEPVQRKRLLMDKFFDQQEIETQQRPPAEKMPGKIALPDFRADSESSRDTSAHKEVKRLSKDTWNPLLPKEKEHSNDKPVGKIAMPTFTNNEDKVVVKEQIPQASKLDVRCFQFIDEQQVVSQKQEPVPRKRLVTEELFSQQETETQQRPPLEKIPGKLTLPDLSADNDLSRGTPAHKEVNKLPRDKWNPLPPQEIEHTNGKPVGKIAIPTFPNDDEKVVVNEQISQVSKLDRSRLQFTEQQVVPPKEEPVQRKRLLMDKFFDQQEIETKQRPPAEKMPGKIALPDFRADSESSRDTSAHKEVKRLSKDTWNPLLPKEKEHSNDKPVGKIAMPTFTNNEDKVVVKEQIPQASKLDVRCFQFIDEQQVVSQKQEPVPRKRLVTEELFSQQETETQQRPPLERIPGKLTLPDLSADNDLSRGTPAHKEVNKLPRDKWNPLPPQEIEHTNGKPVGKIAIPTFPNDDEKVVVNEQISQVSKLDRSRLQFTEQQVVPPKEEPVQRKRLLMDKFFDQQEIETQQRPPAEKMPGKIALPDFRADSESSRDTSAHKEVKRLSKDTWNPLLPKEKEHSNDKPVGKIAMPTFTNNEDKVVVKEQIPQASKLDVRCFQFIDEQQVVSQKQEPVPRKRLVTEELFSQQETETQQRPPLERIPGKLTLPDLSADNDLSRGTPAHKEVNKLPRDKWNPLPPQEIEHTNGKPVGKIAIPTFPNDDEKVVVNEQISQVSKLDRSRLQFTEQQVVPPKEKPIQRKRLLMDKFFDQQEIETQQRPPAEKMPGKIALPDFRADSESSRDTSAHKEVKRLSKDTWNPLLPKEKEHSNDKPVGKIAMPTFTINEDKVVVKEQNSETCKLDLSRFPFIEEESLQSKDQPLKSKGLVTETSFAKPKSYCEQSVETSAVSPRERESFAGFGNGLSGSDTLKRQKPGKLVTVGRCVVYRYSSVVEFVVYIARRS